MGVQWSQFFPPAPSLTEANLPRQTGRVFLVTGGSSGVGRELCRILYGAGARVYLAGRSRERCEAAIADIIASCTPPPDAPAAPAAQPGDGAAGEGEATGGPGQLHFLPLDLADLRTVPAAVSAFAKKETRLDALFNNAGVSLHPPGSATAQGHELLLGTNCLGPFLLTRLLSPLLAATAAASPQGGVRVVWTSSQTVDLSAPPGGFEMAELGRPPAGSISGRVAHYLTSKVGNWFLCGEFARRCGGRGEGVVHVVQNPGNLRTRLLRHVRWMEYATAVLLHKPVFGAYTELWAGLSEDITAEDGGGYVVPWGRKHPAPRADLLLALKGVDEGGTGRAREFYDWCEEKTREYI